VRTNFVASLDGSAQGDDGRSGTLNTPSDQHVFATLRAHADVVLVGAQTVRSEGYRAIDLAPWQVDLRRDLGRAPFPLLAVLTAGLGLDPSLGPTGDHEGPVLVMTTEEHDEADLAPFRSAGVEVVTFPGDQVPIEAAVAHLVQRGCPRILSEGGAGLNHRLLEAGLVDEVCLTLSARMVGGDGGRTVAGAPLQPNPTFELAHLLHADDGALFTRYTRARVGGPGVGEG
jgi:riboflavin biosynthesis pyrimidine reductase